jgi:DNA-binding CsgD family transcriptional regulator
MPKIRKRRLGARPKELARLLATLPIGRRRVAVALIAEDCGCTYDAVAKRLGLHVGTVYQHLRRIRLRHPNVYAALMRERARQLTERHRRACARAEAHSRVWLKMTGGVRYIYPV